MFTHAHNIAITGGNFVTYVGNSAFEKLQKASAPSAFHNSSTRFDPPKCHPNTRVAILEYLMGWIFGHNNPEALILWLYGPAGAGKSAILQTIAERCFEHKVLLASFFFGRSDPTRDTFKPLIATIAYQIVITIPEMKPLIESVIERDPLIFDKSIATQLQSLIIDPLKHLITSGILQTFARLILIDGLDECDDPRMQSMILRSLADALRDHKLPLIFLIASRPEQSIRLTFNSPPLAELWRSLVLNASVQSYSDIRHFLMDKFAEIKTTHPHRNLIPVAWPNLSDIDTLVEKSSGQFIYASVVGKYVSAAIDRPPRRLEVVLGLRPVRGDVPFSELDALYMHILGSCVDPDTVLSILFLVIRGIAYHTYDIEMVLDLEPGDAVVALSPLASIIGTIKRIGDDPYIKLRHASFRDFLIDISRSGPFNIDTLTMKERLLHKSISKLMNPYSIICRYPGTEPVLAVILGSPFYPSLNDVPLTETVASALKGFSLPQFWSIWMTEPYSLHGGQADIIYSFLNFLSGNPDVYDPKANFYPRPLGYSKIYAVHLSSFESIIQSEIQKYYQDVALTSLVVILFLEITKNIDTAHISKPGLIALWCLTEESEKQDENSLSLLSAPGRDLLATHYRYLFVGPRKSAEVCPDGKKHAQVALRVLEYLCTHSPHPIPFKIHQTLKLHSQHTRPSGLYTRSSSPFPYHNMARRMRLTSSGFLRNRREEKQRYGVALSPPLQGNLSYASKSCEWGLVFLPYLLESSSYSAELADFIRRCGKYIAVMPKTTRKAIRAMHEYLDRW